MKLRRGAKFLLALLGGCSGLLYYAFIGRAYQTVDKDGWHLEFSYVRVACRTCSGNIERLEYAGRPLGTPALWREKTGLSYIEISTPVGTFKWLTEFKRWLLKHDQERSSSDVAEQITTEELKQGYYDLEYDLVPSAASTQPSAFPRKTGTPTSWCPAIPAKFSYIRWFDPVLIDKLRW